MGFPREMRAIQARLSRAAILTDFDGTLSPIVADPRRALPVPGAREVLAALARRAGLVAVITGRSASFVERLGVPAVGQHGHEVGLPLESVMRAAAQLEALGLPVEVKSHMLTVHYRSQPWRRGEATDAASEVAERLGLSTAPAKMGVELRPTPSGKGEVVERLTRAAAAAVYAGDDHGDIPAFRALRRLAVPTVAVAVMGRETPQEVVREADVLCLSPYEWVSWLKAVS